MENLWLFTDKYVQMVSLRPFHRKELTVGSDLSDTITIPVRLEEKIRLIWDPVMKEWGRRSGDEWNTLAAGKMHFFKNQDRNVLQLVYQTTSADPAISAFYIGQKRLVSMSGKSDADFCFPDFAEAPGFSLSKERDGWHAFPDTADSRVYVNGERMHQGFRVENGDIISWKLNEWTLRSDDMLSLSAGDRFTTELFPAREPRTMLADKYPDYQRMPRLIYERPKERVKFSWPSGTDGDGRRNLWIMILPPAIMMLVMLAVLFIQPSGIYMLISVVMFLSTIVTSVFTYFYESKRSKERAVERKANYTSYLEEKREELNRLYEKQRFVLRYQFPDSDRIKELVRQLSPRIWERSREDSDFLDLRLGLTDLPPDYVVEGSEQDLTNRSFDALYREAKQILDHYKGIKNVPLTIRLLDGPLGIVGKHSIIRKTVQQMILQLAFFHSYHDLHFVILFDAEEYAAWSWLKWLPHLKSLSTKGRNFVYNEQTRDQLLPGIYEQLKARAHTDHKEKKVFLPHLVFIIASDRLIHEHEIAEFLNRDYTDIGVSSIFLANTKDNLNENMNSVVRYINEHEGDVLIRNKVANGQKFRIDPFTTAGNENFARCLASLNHRSGFSNSIPESVTFLEMMHAEDVGDLQIARRWAAHDPTQSLSVPIGLRSKNDVLELNLHEKAHGPHGLLAGTTGSGKSELLQSYILSLAVNFSPHDVAFLLIDFKGGGMAQLFEKLPHLLGTMTNINDEKNFSERALAAVKSESRRRQMLFAKYNINHIDDYQLLHKQGKVKQPIPHLFIISDEFAELKKEEPEFIRELVTTARIGRSLGIHLILATQKPAGVVDDQIRSNSRFKICLRVQDASDSNDILGNGDASELKQIGRGYLQVGNNEMYELFQSAWSGAPYEKNIYTSEDDVYYVQDTGLYPISEVHAKTEVQVKKETELDVIVKAIADLSAKMGLKRLPSPWLAPLPVHLVRPAASQEERDGDRIMIGLADHPEKQQQTPVFLKLKKERNIAIFGASGFGKTMTMVSYLLESARRYSPQQVQLYLFDFGSGGLLPFARLHHTGDYFRLDEKEKIKKFAKWLNREIQHRKDLFRESGVPDINLYNQQAETELAYLKIVVDNFEAIREEAADELEELFVRWAREGSSLGIQFILSVSRSNGIRPNLLSSMPVRLSHYMVDQSDFYSIFSGSVKKTVGAIPGRALIKTEELESIQIGLPFDAKTAAEQLEQLRAAIATINQRYPECRTIYHVPMLPERLETAGFLQRQKLDTDTIYFGLDEESVVPLGINRNQTGAFIIVGDARRGKTNALWLILEQLITDDRAQVAISDSEEMAFSKMAEAYGWMYLEDSDMLTLYIEQLEETFAVREKEIREKMLTSGRVRAAIAADYPAWYLLIDSLDTFSGRADNQAQTRLINLMKRFGPIGFHVVATGNQTEWKSYDPLAGELKNTKDGLLLIRKSDQSVFTLPFASKEADPVVGFGYLIHQGQDRRIMIPLTSSPVIHPVNG